jgi:uncharacterized protein YjbI with pentapeptide repeats
MLTLTGLTQAQATVACHRIGKNIFGADVHTILFSESEIEQLRPSDPPPESKQKSKKPKRHIPVKKKDPDAAWTALKSKSPVLIAEFLELPLDQILTTCHELGINVHGPAHELRKKDAESVRNHISISRLEAAQSNHTVDSSTPMIEVSITTPRKTIEAVGRATTKRIEVVARENNESIDQIYFVIKALHIPIVHGDKEKISVHHEDDIRVALGLLDDLPNDRRDRGEVRIRPMIESRGLALSVVQQFCSEKSLQLRHGKYATTEDGLRLALLLSDPAILRRLRNESHPTQETEIHENLTKSNEASDKGFVVDYREVDLSRQNFTGFDFEAALMTAVNLSFCKLVDAKFSRANIDNADVTRAICVRANFSHSQCNTTNFSRAVLEHANFHGASLTDANLLGCSFMGTNFSNANLKGAAIKLQPHDVIILNNTTWTDGRIVNSMADIEGNS